MERELGFYWTKMSDLWIVSAWTGDEWRIPGQYHPAFDVDFQEIDERPLKRIEDGHHSGTNQGGEEKIK